MYKNMLWQNTVMVTVSFIAGVVCFQLFSLEQAKKVINIMDKRILFETAPTIVQSIVPVAIAFSVVLLFATHPYFFNIAKIAIAFKTCFFGFSSVYLLAQQNELLGYGIWWFPFQFLYVVILVLLSEYLTTTHKVKKRKGDFSLRPGIVILIIIGFVFALEMVVISYVFK